MRANKCICIALLSVEFLLLKCAFAQIASPTPLPQGYIEGQDEPASDTVGSGRRKLGYVRLWIFADPSQVPVGAYALENAEQTQVELDHWICRGNPPGFLGGFKELPAGKFSLHVEGDENPQISVLPDGNAHAVIQKRSSILTSPTVIEVKPADYQTVLLFREGEKFKVHVVSETGLSGSQRKLRLLNFSENKATVSRIRNGKSEGVGEIAPNQVSDILVSSEGGLTDYEVQVADKNGKTRSYSLQIDHSQGQIATIAIFRDKYGRMAAQPVDGAPVGAKAAL